MKFNLKVFKKGKPIYWIIGAVVLFVAFYFIASRGGSSASGGGGGVNVYNPGASDAALAIGAQVQMAQIQGNALAMENQLKLAAIQEQGAVDLALAQIAGNVALNEIGASKDISALSIQAQTLTEGRYLDTQKEIAEINSEYSLETSRTAAEYAFKSQQLNADVINNQLATNAQMFNVQAQNLTQQALISQVGNLKKKNRDETLQYFAGAFSANPASIVNTPRGTVVNTMNVA